MENKEYIIKWLNTNTGLNTQSIYDFARKVDELYKQDFNKQLILHDVVVPKGAFYCWDEVMCSQTCKKQCVDCKNENKGVLQQ